MFNRGGLGLMRRKGGSGTPTPPPPPPPSPFFGRTAAAWGSSSPEFGSTS